MRETVSLFLDDAADDADVALAMVDGRVRLAGPALGLELDALGLRAEPMMVAAVTRRVSAA